MKEEVRIEQVLPSVVWPIRHKVMYPDGSFDSIKLAEDDNGVHLALYGEELISVISLFKEGDELQFRKFATLQQYQGRGYGSKLLQYVLDMARGENVYRVWCNARQSAAAFYKRFSFEETDEIFQRNGIHYVIMELKFQAPSSS